MKTTEELRKLDAKKLMEELEATAKKLCKLEFEVRSGQSENIADVKKLSRQVARIKTIAKENASEKSKNSTKNEEKLEKVA